MADIDIVVQEFSPDQAGERVAWIGYSEREGQFDPYGVLDVAIGTVGREGAQVSYVELGNGERGAHRNSVKGFLGATSLSVTLPLPEPRLADLTQFSYGSSGLPMTYGDVETPNSVMRGANRYNSARIYDEDVEWVEGNNLAPEIKRVLGSKGLEAAYPTVYIALNYSIMHKSIGVRDRPDLAQPVADHAMHEVTSGENEQVGILLGHLVGVREEDELVQSELARTSDGALRQLAGRFEQSRRLVADHEADVLQAANRMLFRWGAHLPIGFRPNGRTWPYMDPVAQDETKAFGQELKALMDNEARPAQYELTRELKELDKRIDHAKAARNTLSRLQSAERRRIVEATP